MDVPRKPKSRWTRFFRRLVVVIVGAAVLGLGTYGFSRLRPAVPKLSREQIVTGVVQRGDMLRQVGGNGRLVPEEVIQVTSETSGRVKEVFVAPGAEVVEDTLLLELENPQVEKWLRDAELSLKAQELALTNFLVRLERDKLDLRASTYRLVADYDEARLQSEIDDELWKNGLISKRQHRLSQARSSQALEMRDIQLERVRLSLQTIDEQVAIENQRVENAQQNVQLAQDTFDALKVHAGCSGTLQQLGPSPRYPLEVGQQIGNGGLIAAVTTSSRLKAQLSIPQAQASDVVVDQTVKVEAVSSRETMDGRVERIIPGVQGGTVVVEVELIGDMLKGMRPDLSVYGIIEIERLENVLFVNRPLHAQANRDSTVFKLADNGVWARTPVAFGPSSISTIVVTRGLDVGDKVILTDMSAWEEADEVVVD